MTLKFIDGFESFDNAADLIQVYPGSSNHGSILFPTEGRRAGTKCFDWDVGYTNAIIRPPVDTTTFAVSEYAIVGFAFKVKPSGTGGSGISFFLDNGSSGDGGGCRWDFVGNNSTYISVQYCHQFGTSEIDTISYEWNQWNYFEIKCKIGNGTDGHIVARLNEQELINWTGDNHHLHGFQIERFYFNPHSDWDIQIDDFYIAGSNGSYNNDFLGDVRVDAINPNGAGNHTDLTPSAGANYECVDEVVIDESDYVEGANIGDIDSYSYADVPTDLDDASIFGICLRNISQRTAGSDNIKIDALLRTGSTDYNSASEISLTDDWYAKDFIFEKDPSDSGDWTKAKINACEFGMEVSA